MSVGKCDYPISELECKIIMDQIARRAKYRQEWLRAKSDPCKHSQEAGYVFDPAMQRFISMKATGFQQFKPAFSNIFTGLGFVVFPMLAYGYLIYDQRTKMEDLIRCGKLRYADRRHRLR